MRGIFLDECAEFVDDLVDGLAGGVHMDGVVGRFERGDSALGVALVALGDVGLDFFEADLGAFGLKFAVTSLGPFFDVGVEVEFDRSVGKNDGTLVAAFGNEGIDLAGNPALLFDQELADFGTVGDFVGVGGDFPLADSFGNILTVEGEEHFPVFPTDLDAALAGDLGEFAIIIQIDLLAHGRDGNSSIHRSGIEIAAVEAAGQDRSDGAFSRSGRTVDGDNAL